MNDPLDDLEILSPEELMAHAREVRRMYDHMRAAALALAEAVESYLALVDRARTPAPLKPDEPE